MSRFAGMPVRVSPYATTFDYPPLGRTDDMRAMVDDLTARGVIAKSERPAAYRVMGVLVIHPVLYARLLHMDRFIRPQTIIDYRAQG